MLSQIFSKSNVDFVSIDKEHASDKTTKIIVITLLIINKLK
jgi:hypothetical protein